MGDFFKTYLKQHFIYNALNCAISLCRKNPEEASELLICLSECLHYTSFPNKDFVLLREEIEFINSYLYVQSVRFSPRIELICDTDKEINCNIIRFSMHKYIDDILENILKNTNDNIIFKINTDHKQQKAVVETLINGECKYVKEFP